MIDMNELKCYRDCKGIENHLHVYLYKGNPQEDIRPLDPSPFLPHGSNEPPSVHDLPKAGQQACQTWSEKTRKCSSTSHAVEFRVSFEMELTESKQTIYRQAVANTADVHRDEVNISNLAVLEDDDELSEPVRRVAGNETVEFDTIVAAANNRHPSPPLPPPPPPPPPLPPLPPLPPPPLSSFLIVACRLMPTGGVNSPLLSCSALPSADEIRGVAPR
jgi:hypothetical protein